MSARSGKTSARVDFIDLLRGVAVLVMIETHVVNTTLSTEVISGIFFQYLKFVNGLVAPTFLFASGLAYAVTTHRKIPAYLSFSPPLFLHLRRILSVLAIGYLLHVPIVSVQRMAAEATPEQWQSFFQVDILQCIAVSFLLLQILLLVTRSEGRLYASAFVIAVTVVLSSPFVWQIDYWERFPWVIAAYMNGIRDSLFPLFPWLSFLFVGALVGFLFVRMDRNGDGQKFRSSLAWIGGSVVLLSHLADGIGESLLPAHDYWLTSPAFFLLRLGIVIMFCAFLARHSSRSTGRIRAGILLFGSESLLVYVAHLLILYGDYGSFNLQGAIGHTFHYPEAAVLTAGLIGLMFATAFWWRKIKQDAPRLKRVLTALTILAVAALFTFGEG